MVANIERIKQTVRELLNLANNDGAAEGEVRNALHFAQKYMNEHHLTEEDLAVEPGVQVADIDNAELGKVKTSVGGCNCEWEHQLCWFVCRFVGGIKWHYSNALTPDRDARGFARSGGHKKSVTFYGLLGDSQIGAELYDELRLTIITMAKLKFNGCYRGAGRSYAEGFVEGLRDKLDEEKRNERLEAQRLIESGEATSTALVLVDRRNALVARKRERAIEFEELNLRFGGRVNSTGNGAHHGGAYGEGKTDGRKTNVTAGERRRQIS